MTSEEMRRDALAAIAEIHRLHAEQIRIEAAPYVRILEMLPMPKVVFWEPLGPLHQEGLARLPRTFS